MPARTIDELQYADLRTFRESVRGKSRWHEYATPPTDVPANASFTNPIFRSAFIQIDGDSHFLCRELTGQVLFSPSNLVYSFTGNGQPSLQIFDSGSKVTLFDKPTAWLNVVGVAQRPYPLKPPFLFRAKSRVRVDFYNGDSGASVVRFQLVMGGTRIFLR